MITAHNYAAQAERDLHHFVLEAQKQHLDIGPLDSFAKAIGRAVHFALPDDGRIFDDDFRGICDTSLRLPFPFITVEYYVANPETNDHKVSIPTVHTKKRLALAVEVDGANGIEIEVFVTNFYNGRWVPFPMAARIMQVTQDVSNLNGAFEIGDSDGQHKARMLFKPYMAVPYIVEQLTKMKNMTTRGITELCACDIGDEMTAVLELVEALSCVNVHHEPIEIPKMSVAARRARDNKLPLYETRRLVIDVPSVITTSNPLGGTHASPRQHLRRGHIRRLLSGNIWVNSCVVGRSEHGVIDKQYRVRVGGADFRI